MTTHIISNLQELSNFEFEIPNLSLDHIKFDRPNSILLHEENSKIRNMLSIWFDPQIKEFKDKKVAYIGHIHVENEDILLKLINEAKAYIKNKGYNYVISPMDGSTWKKYRLVVDGDKTIPPFYLEPLTPDYFVKGFVDSGFKPISTYYSTLVTPSSESLAKIDEITANLAKYNITIDNIQNFLHDKQKFINDIYHLTINGFEGNYLYSPLSIQEFSVMYMPLLEKLDPKYFVVAVHEGKIIGYLLNYPNYNEMMTGKINTFVLKTLTVDSKYAGKKIGTLFYHMASKLALQDGFTNVIHSLMQEDNYSLKISHKMGAKNIRKYQVFGCDL
ncbi:MAG: GNAT family N-acetyltransferase [Alphaproteobacteria bacterium]|nr:GNAT family N-acetyltransferase [Alphaproteobacteria bacterium]OJV11944.1 MAG: hypothetical protein BGO27_00570 [Alphaproteobacteria bacterium 33-17]